MNSKLVLGLDLGPNSVGWALIDEGEHQKILDCGVRVFPEGVDNFDTKKEKPRNEARRIARGMRRQIARRARRRRRLRESLITAGLLPGDPAACRALLDRDPYELRAKAATEKVALHELGRAIQHLGHRRGFLSNRKRERATGEVKGMLAEINELAAAIEGAGCTTLGQYLHGKSQSFDHACRTKDDHVRRRHTHRPMLVAEFDTIWRTQAKHYPDVLTETLRYGAAGPQKQPQKPRRRRKGESLLEAFGIEGLLFFQRPLYWPRSVIGQCELEPKEKRCPRADRRAQEFRMLQEVNNLRYIDPETGEEQGLDPDSRTLLLEYLSKREKATFDEIRKKLGFLESVRFNLERGKRTSLLGMPSDHALGGKKALGTAWDKLPEDARNGIVLALAKSTDDDDTHDYLVREYGLTPDQADAALGVELSDKYVNLSIKAIDKLLPHLRRGLQLMGNDETDSAMHAAGYMRRDQLQRRMFDQLPEPARVRAGEARISDIPNPVVKRAIVELRKVVNAIIREYGKPSEIHVEMAREVRQGPKQRSEYTSRIRDIEAEREHAAEEIRKMGIRVSRDGILQYQLWRQQDHKCIYCGDNISQPQLFGGDIAIDHILPYSRSLDDGQQNKVVCHSRCNDEKRNRTPHEWLANSEPEKYERLCQTALGLVRTGSMPYGKYKKLIQKELKLDDFIARQLTATSYIARATAEYLRCLFEHDHDVLGLKGELTAELRHQWGLDDVLSTLPDSPAWQEQNDLRPGEKNRADHRHHTIDAIIVALTNRKRLQELSRIRKQGGMRETGEVLDDPWPRFRDEVIAKIREVKVSRRVERKVAGALHEDTFYGRTPVEGVFVVRKPLDSLSPNEVPLIRDKNIRKIVKRRLAEHGIEIGRGKKADAKAWKAAMTGVSMPSGVPIKRVRVLRRERTIRPLHEDRPDQTHVKPGSTHHLAIFEWEEKGKRKRDAVFVTMLEAINRLKRREQIIQRTPPVGHETIPPNAKFQFSLSRGEHALGQRSGESLLTMRTAISTDKRIVFGRHMDARQSDGIDKILYSRKDYDKLRKVAVDPLGRIRWAND